MGKSDLILSKSRRNQRDVHGRAMAWIRRMPGCEPIEYQPRDADGEVRRMESWIHNPSTVIQAVEQDLADGKTVMALASCEIVPRPKRPKTSHIGPVRGDSWMTGPDGSAEPSGPVVRRKERVMENPTLGRIEAEYLNGVRSGNVRKKRLRNGNRRIRRDRASGMSYIDLGAKYELSRAILHQIINRRWRRPPVQLALDGALARRSLCSDVLRESVRFDRDIGATYHVLAAKYGLTRNELYIIVHDLRSSSSGVERRPGGRRSRDDGGDGHG